MSLDVYLILSQEFAFFNEKQEIIYIREGGQTIDISRDKWNKRFPGKEPFITIETKKANVVYRGNITHNLNEMSIKCANLYTYLWRPEEINVFYAKDLIVPVERRLNLLKKKKEYFEQYNPRNGWGNYDVLVSFVEEYLEKCKTFPIAKVSVWR